MKLTMEQRWEFISTMFSSPAAFDEMMCVGGTDGTLTTQERLRCATNLATVVAARTQESLA